MNQLPGIAPLLHRHLRHARQRPAVLAVRGIHDYTLLLLVHADDLPEDHGRVLMFPENPADRRADLPGTEDRSRHLVKQRLKHVMIVPIDQDDARWRLPKRLRGGQAAKAAGDNDDVGYVIHHGTCRPLIRL
jgi:hypothetical protein